MITLLVTLLAGITSLMIGLFVGGLWLVFYIWESLEFYWLFKICSYNNAWMAWIPILRYYALAEVTGDATGQNRLYLINRDISTDLFRFWPILTLVVSRIESVGGILELILTILCLGSSFTTIYSKFENRHPDEVKVIGYLSGWIPLIGIIKLTQYKHRQS